MSELNIKEIHTLDYARPDIKHGYANQHLIIDLSSAAIAIEPNSPKMKEIFIGGKGFDLWLLWNAVSGSTKWNDAENAVCIASGPLAGTPNYPGTGTYLFPIMQTIKKVKW